MTLLQKNSIDTSVAIFKVIAAKLVNSFFKSYLTGVIPSHTSGRQSQWLFSKLLQAVIANLYNNVLVCHTVHLTDRPTVCTKLHQFSLFNYLHLPWVHFVTPPVIAKLGVKFSRGNTSWACAVEVEATSS